MEKREGKVGKIIMSTVAVGKVHNDLLFSALEFYTKRNLKLLNRRDGYIIFDTEEESGVLLNNVDGDWELYLNGKNIGLIEKPIFDLCGTSENPMPIVDLYNECKKIIKNNKVNETSNKFLINLFINIGTYLLTTKKPIGEPVKIGYMFLCDVGNKRIELNLN